MCADLVGIAVSRKAPARNLERLKALNEAYGECVLTLALDVTRKVAVDEAMKQAYEHFDRLDVVINNAGYGLFGAAEEVSEQAVSDQLETNPFGAIWMAQAAVPYLRAQGSGHIIQVPNIGGVNAFTSLSLYHASKWALEGFSQEVQSFGIKVTLIEPIG